MLSRCSFVPLSRHRNAVPFHCSMDRARRPPSPTALSSSPEHLIFSHVSAVMVPCYAVLVAAPHTKLVGWRGRPCFVVDTFSQCVHSPALLHAKARRLATSSVLPVALSLLYIFLLYQAVTTAGFAHTLHDIGMQVRLTWQSGLEYLLKISPSGFDSYLQPGSRRSFVQGVCCDLPRLGAPFATRLLPG